MKIINLMLVDNYISGKGKISEKRLEKLENDPEFMMCAMNRSNDPKLYRLCSHEVKTNYNFVKYYVNKFSNDVDAIDKAARYFLQYSKNEYINFELCILMKTLTYKDERTCCEYGIRVESVSLIDDCTISIISDDLKDEFSKKSFGLGFIHIQDMYQESKIIVDHYAKRLISNLFEEKRKLIERELHSKFETFDKFKEYGINKFIIDYIIQYDYHLASYIQLNPELMSCLNNVIESISYRWYVYRKKLDSIRYKQILRVYDEFMLSCNNVYNNSYYELLMYIVKDLEISEDILDFEDELYSADYEEIFGYNNPINISGYDVEKLDRLKETIQSIIIERDPMVIRNSHIKNDKCVVSRLRSKTDTGAKITQL